MKNILIGTVFAFTLTSITGCSFATKEQLNVVESKMSVIASKAESANKLASQAMERANSAQTTANNALNCCAEQRSRLDNMFEKAMHK